MCFTDRLHVMREDVRGYFQNLIKD